MTATDVEQTATSAERAAVPTARSRRWHAPVAASVANPRRTRGLAVEEMLGAAAR